MIKCLLRKYLFCLLIIVGLGMAMPVSAEENFYKAEYDVVHKLQSDFSINTKLIVNLTNTRSDVFITKFSILIPSSTNISDLKAFSPSGVVTTSEKKEQEKTLLIFNFDDPTQGKNQSTLLEISFNQMGVVINDGKTIEALLPTFASNKQPTRVTFDTVSYVDSQLSIAKPRPSLNEKTVFTWDSVSIPMVYVVFGPYQLYTAKLNYLLYNDRLTPVKQDVAFPPETLRQSILVKSISPKPNETFIDDDGNFIGRYVLNPQEKKKITFDGVIKVMASDQEDMIEYVRSRFKHQKNYLLSNTKHWSINNPLLIKSLEKVNTAPEIYKFVTDQLEYSFSRFGEKTERLGADAAFSTPKKAVCMEYADLFVGISREKGYFSREIQGYGYSKDPRLRPQSLEGDILHAWAEYYDISSERWIAVDPTWEDTSGIDYLHGFDLNHIVFAIHGQDSIYPLPAGMYKTDTSKDVHIKTIVSDPMEKKAVDVRLDFSDKVFHGKKNKGNIFIINTGNVFLKNTALSISSDNLKISPSSKIVGLIAPYQTVTIPVFFSTVPKKDNIPVMTITLGSLYSNSIKFEPVSESVQSIIGYIKLGSIAVIFIILLMIVIRRYN